VNYSNEYNSHPEKVLSLFPSIVPLPLVVRIHTRWALCTCNEKGWLNSQLEQCTPRLSFSIPVRLNKDKNRFPSYTWNRQAQSIVISGLMETFKAAVSSIKY